MEPTVKLTHFMFFLYNRIKKNKGNMYSLNTLVIFYAFSIGLGTFVSLKGITDEDSISQLFPQDKFQRTSDDKPEGIFERFLRLYLDMLSTALTEKQLLKYCKMMYEELKNMEFTYTERLAKVFRHLSRKCRDNIRDEMIKYRKEFDEKLPHRQAFLQAFNEVFTLQQNLQFEDYIHDLVEYGNEHKLFIHYETRKLLNDVIVNSVDKMGKREKRALEKKLRLAIEEYNDDESSSNLSSSMYR